MMRARTSEQHIRTEPDKRLEQFRQAFEEFVEDPHVAGTIDEFYDTPETHIGLWVSGESGNIVTEFETNPKDDGKRRAFDREFLEYGGR